MIPDEYDHIYVRSGVGGTHKVVHAPGERGPLCAESAMTRGGREPKSGYLLKDSTAVPDGFYDDCSRCIRVLESDDVEFYIDEDPPWTDADRLERLYHDEKLSSHEIADRLGCANSTVLYWMDKHDISRRSYDEAYELRDQGGGG